MATTTTIRGITYNSGNYFTSAYSGKWYGSADGGNGSGTIPSGASIKFVEDRTGWADWYYHPILVQSSAFDGGEQCWTDINIFPYAKVTVKFDSGGGTKTYTWGTGGNFPSVSKTGYKHAGWKIDGVTYNATSSVANSWISERNNQTKTATAVWEAQASTISSATNVTLSTSETVDSTVSWSALSSNFTYVLTASLGNASASATYDNLSGNVSKTLGFSTDWINAITTAKSASVTITLTTKNGDTVLGTSTKAITVTVPTGIKPSVSSITFTKVSALNSTYFSGKICTLIDKVKVGWTETLSYSSDINTRSVSVNNETLSATTNNATTTNTLVNYGTQSATVSITDKRGNRGSLTSNTLNVYKYFYPDVTIKYNHSGSDYKIHITGSIAYVGGSNSKALVLKIYKGESTTTTGTYTLTSSISAKTGGTYDAYYPIDITQTIDSSYITDIDTDTYRFEVTVTDSVKAVTAKVYSGITVMTLKAGGTEIIMKKPVTFEQDISIGGTATFEQGILIDDTAMTDFVIEQGTSSVTGGSWYYRKWVNGCYECWFRSSSALSVSITTSWAGQYYGTIPTIDFPITFIDYPVMQVTVQAAAGGAWAAPDYPSKSQTGPIYMYRPTSTTKNCYVNIYAQGRWK